MMALIVYITIAIALLFSSIESAGSLSASLISRVETALHYSAVSYCLSDPIMNWNCEVCDNAYVSGTTAYLHDNVASLGIRFWIGVNEGQGRIILGFAGTSSTEGWITDAEFSKVSYKFPSNKWNGEVLVHKGFYEGYLVVCNTINSYITSLLKKYPSYTVMVTGHSLGGAMAQLAALNLTLSYNIQPHVVTFEGPRVGDSSWADMYNYYIRDTPLRTVNQRDIVPHVPPSSDDYYHAVQEIWLQQYDNWTSDYKLCSATNGEDPDCSDSLYFPTSFHDHCNLMGMNICGCPH